MREGDIFVQPEAGQQGDRKNDTERGDVRGETQTPPCPLGKGELKKFERSEIDVNEVVTDDEVICQEIQNPVQDHIASATGCVPKNLLWYVVLKRRIYKINNFCNYLG